MSDAGDMRSTSTLVSTEGVHVPDETSCSDPFPNPPPVGLSLFIPPFPFPSPISPDSSDIAFSSFSLASERNSFRASGT